MKKSILLIPSLLFTVACTPVALPAASLAPVQTQTRSAAQVNSQVSNQNSAQTAIGGTMMSSGNVAIGSQMMSQTSDASAYDAALAKAYLQAMANSQAASGYDAYASGYGYADAGYSGSAQTENSGDAWAGTCGPNADYNEQLVCSGVPASMLP